MEDIKENGLLEFVLLYRKERELVCCHLKKRERNTILCKSNILTFFFFLP